MSTPGAGCAHIPHRQRNTVDDDGKTMVMDHEVIPGRSPYRCAPLPLDSLLPYSGCRCRAGILHAMPHGEGDSCVRPVRASRTDSRCRCRRRQWCLLGWRQVAPVLRLFRGEFLVDIVRSHKHQIRCSPRVIVCVYLLFTQCRLLYMFFIAIWYRRSFIVAAPFPFTRLPFIAQTLSHKRIDPTCC